MTTPSNGSAKIDTPAPSHLPGDPPCLACGSFDTARAVIVLLHGYAMDPGAFTPFAQTLNLPAVFVFPRGPHAADPGGAAWWPIDASERATRSGGAPRDLAHKTWPERPQARARLAALLAEVRKQAGSIPLILGGFSQGGMLALDLLLTDGADIDGLIILSSSRIAIDEWTPHLHRLRNLPILLAHGREDAELAFTAGCALRELFEEAGARVNWLPFDEGHVIPLVVWRNIRRFVTFVQNSTTPADPNAK